MKKLVDESQRLLKQSPMSSLNSLKKEHITIFEIQILGMVMSFGRIMVVELKSLMVLGCLTVKQCVLHHYQKGLDIQIGFY